MLQSHQLLHGLAGLTLSLGLVSAIVFKPLLDQGTSPSNLQVAVDEATYDQDINPVIGTTCTTAQLETLRSSVAVHWSDHLWFETGIQPIKLVETYMVGRLMAEQLPTEGLSTVSLTRD